MTRLDEAIASARSRLPAAEARLLLGLVLQRSQAWLLGHGDVELDTGSLQKFAELVVRREAGEPVAYLLGAREFYGRIFGVKPGVLIPRPETELLVDIAREVIAGVELPRILDLGTGSGCIALTLALECPSAEVTATDASEDALTIARDNAARLGARIRFVQSDWYSALSGQRFDLIVSNPPYVAAIDPHLELGDLRYEPRLALASGADGLNALRHIIANASLFLTAGGHLYVEHGYDQAATVRELLVAAGFVDIARHRDLAGIVRVSGGRQLSV